MANINKELNDIKSAIYGKDVRGSIHDGIKKINDETEVATNKAEAAHDVMETIINDGFDNAALEAEFEQKLGNEIANLQPEWTQFKEDTETQLAETEKDLESIEKANSKDILPLTNYLGNMQNIHPKVISFENEWNGFKYWMAYTPYPFGDSDKENPCLAASNNMTNWYVPEGVTNPLQESPPERASYNSDTHILYREDKSTLEIWWRQVDSVNNKRVIYRSVSNNGTVWGKPEIVRTLDPADDWLSPAVIFEDGKYKVWFCKTGVNTVRYVESNGDTISSWGDVIDLDMDWDSDNLRPWHLDVTKTEKGYEMVVCAFDRNTGTSSTADLYHLIQKNNGTFTKPKMILGRSNHRDAIDHISIYRSSLLWENDTYYLFYSSIDRHKQRWISLSVGKRIEGLNGYTKANPVVKRFSGETLSEYYLANIDELRFRGSGNTIESLQKGYEGQRVVVMLGTSGTSVDIKSGSGVFFNNMNDDLILTGKNKRVYELIFDGDYWFLSDDKSKVYNEIENRHVTNYDVSGVDIIRFKGDNNRIESLAPGYQGQKISLVVARSNTEVIVKHSASVYLPYKNDIKLNENERVLELMFDGTTWFPVGYEPKGQIKFIEDTKVYEALDVSDIETINVQGDVTINSLVGGYYGKKITIFVSSSTAKVKFPFSGKLVTPNSDDFILDNRKIGVTLIRTSPSNDVWRLF